MKTSNRILIIDDEEIVRDSIREILSPSEEEDFSSELDNASADLFGKVEEVIQRNPSKFHPHFEIIEATNGEDGLQKVIDAKAQNRPYNVIFIDMRMPGWDGLTTCVEIRKIDPKAQVFFVTAYTDRSIEEIVKLAGGDVGYLSKPFMQEEILQLATKGLYDWARLTNLEKLLEIIGEIGFGTGQLKTLLTNILHQIADYIGTNYSVLGKFSGDEFEEISVLGSGKHSIGIKALVDKVNIHEIKDVVYTEGVIICPLEQYCIFAIPSEPDLFNQEKIYLLSLFVENAVRAIKNSELSEELMKSEKLSAVGQAITMVMHDIRNPISQVRSFAEMIKADPGNAEENAEMADYILQASHNATDIIADVLDFSRNASLTKEEHSVDSWLNKCLPQLDNSAKFAKVKLTVEVEEGLNAHIDRKKMDRVIINLINNAREALIDAGVENPAVNVKSFKRGNETIIQVQDNGPGIPDEIQNKLFEAFTTSNKKNGTGLGLAIVHQIIEAHGGYIRLNDVAEGAEFEIGLPS